MKVTKVSSNGRKLPWKVDGYFDGKRVRRFFGTKGEAEAEARRLSSERRETGTLGERLSARERIVFADLRDACLEAGGTLEEAVGYWMAHVGKPARPLRLWELLDAAVAAKEGEGKSVRYLGQLRSSVGQLCRWQGTGTRWAHELTRGTIAEWVEGNGWSGKTRRNYLIDVRTVLEWGRGQGVVRGNVTEGMDLPSGKSEEEVGILSVREAARLVAIARRRVGRDGTVKRDGLLLGYVVLGLFAGLRPEREMGLMTLGQLDLEGGTVVVNAGSAKGRARRVVDLAPNAVALLRVWRPEMVAYWRARGWNGGEEGMGVCPRNLRKRLAALREAARMTEWVPDGMRHSFASYHLALWENENKLKAQMGHAAGSEVLWQHYRARVTRRAAERFWSIGAQGGAPVKGGKVKGER